MTGPANFRDRELIRRTWGSAFQMDMVKGKLVFVVGTFVNEDLQSKVEREAEAHGDILQGDFEEDYHKLAFKSMSAFHWSRTVCPSTPWLVKTDDDTVNNMWSLLELFTSMERKNETSTIACSSKNDPAR